MNKLMKEIKKQKFTSRIEYHVYKEENIFTQKNEIKNRYIDITITAKTKEIAEELWYNCYGYLKENFSYDLGWVGCPTIDETKSGKICYYDSLCISDKEEFDDLKDIYKEWKTAS